MKQWRFVADDGTFQLEHADAVAGLYAPVANEAGYYGSITPTGGGDATVDQHHFLMPPVSVIDLHNTRLVRTAWLCERGELPWSITGASHHQKAAAAGDAPRETQDVEVGLLWHATRRQSANGRWWSEMVTFSPSGPQTVELSRITIRNESDAPRTVELVSVVPLYGRSADALRDHRHVTALLNRTTVTANGVHLRPSMTFDERGHALNTTVYAVAGRDERGMGPAGAYPSLDEYIGESGDAEQPRALFGAGAGDGNGNGDGNGDVGGSNAGARDAALRTAGERVDGCEAVGALRFAAITIAPGATYSVYLVAGIFESTTAADEAVATYATPEGFDDALAENRRAWREQVAPVALTDGDSRFGQWMQWVALQPILRRMYGNSFLPYHDYGRGGRGWRDLWQDCLALLLMEPSRVREILRSSFGGVRFDGTNATIVGNAPGTFRADRNAIPRVWMDHGAWPVLTVRLYIDQSGDLGILSEQQRYFSDALWARAKRRIASGDSTVLTTQDGAEYHGSILEHMLIQQLSAFFNAGDNHALLLEGADWNDGLDMAREKGESVAFTALYAANLAWLADVVERLPADAPALACAEELLLLCDRIGDSPVDYGDPRARRARLAAYCDATEAGPSGRTIGMSAAALSADLRAKATALKTSIREREWIASDEGSWFNGYYDNNGARVEGNGPHGVRMTLTGQVFALMSGVATEEQVGAVIESADRHLLDEQVGGYRLNTDFRTVDLTLGRCFGFAYGHKENGAMFSHMAVMYAYALYTRRQTAAAWRVLELIYRAATDFDRARMYPGLPEYIEPSGRGVYPYLTGSASWYLLTLVTYAFGVRGLWGDLLLDPQLVRTQWDGSESIGVSTFFRGVPLHVYYRNPDALETGSYVVTAVAIEGRAVEWHAHGSGALVAAGQLPATEATVVVTLGAKR